MKTLFISREELKEMFRNFNKNVSFSGVTFANVTYANDVSGSRTINKQKQLQKVTEAMITLGSDYENKVNRILENKQDEENPDFRAMKMKGKFYKYGKANPVVASEKNPDFEMLVMIVEAKNRKHRKSVYFHNNKEITIEEAKEKDLLTPSFFNKKSTSGRGSVSEENDFDFNTLGFDKIQSIKLNKTLYLIED